MQSMLTSMLIILLLFCNVPRMVTSKNAEILRIPLIAMQIVLMWPLNVSSKIVTFLMRMYLIISSTSLGICSIGLLLKTIKTNDLVDRSEAIDIFTLTLSAMYKQLVFVNNYNKLHSLTVKANKLECPDGWMAYSELLAVGHCIGGFTAISFWWSCPILKIVFGDTAMSEMRLPINVDFIITFSGWKFVATFLFCTFGLVVAVHIYMAMDCYLFTCIHIANGALNKLSQRIRDLRNIPTDKGRFNELKECIKTHTFILDFLANLDVIFRSLIVVDVMHAIISLSFAMLQMSESKGALEWIKMILFVFYCFLHQYLNSFFGQALLDQQEGLRLALTEIPWVESPNLGSSTYVIMTMASKPLKLSAWRMYFLQYATFTEFVKNMISTYMVLRQLQDNSV